MNKKLLFTGFLILLVGTLLVSTTVTSHAAEEIYVDVNHGSDQNGDGSQSDPYKTITKAVGVADSSTNHTKIYLASGIYSSDSGEDLPLTLDNIDLIGNPDDPSQVEVSGKMTVSNGEVTGIQFYQTLTAAENALVRKNRFTGIGGKAVYIEGTCLVQDNVLENNDSGIGGTPTSGSIEIIGNTFKNTAYSAINGHFYVKDLLISSNQTTDSGISLQVREENYEIVVDSNDLNGAYGGISLD